MSVPHRFTAVLQVCTCCVSVIQAPSTPKLQRRMETNMDFKSALEFLRVKHRQTFGRNRTSLHAHPTTAGGTMAATLPHLSSAYSVEQAGAVLGIRLNRSFRRTPAASFHRTDIGFVLAPRGTERVFESKAPCFRPIRDTTKHPTGASSRVRRSWESKRRWCAYASAKTSHRNA